MELPESDNFSDMAAGSPPPGAVPALRDLLPAPAVQAMVRAWLAEDVPSFDYGGAVVGDKLETANLLCKAPVCGSGSRRHAPHAGEALLHSNQDLVQPSADMAS